MVQDSTAYTNEGLNLVTSLMPSCFHLLPCLGQHCYSFYWGKHVTETALLRYTFFQINPDTHSAQIETCPLDFIQIESDTRWPLDFTQTENETWWPLDFYPFSYPRMYRSKSENLLVVLTLSDRRSLRKFPHTTN